MLPANGKVGKIQEWKAEKWCSLHNSTSHSNKECFQQKRGSKCKDGSTVDGKNSRQHEMCIADSTTVDCKSCCCSNGKIAKKSNENEVEYLPPPGIGFSCACFHPPLSHQADGFQMLVDSESSKHFVDLKLIRGFASRMQDHTEINPLMKIKAAGHNTLLGTAQGILLVVVRDIQYVRRSVKLPIVLVPSLERNLFSTSLAAQKDVNAIFTKAGTIIVDLGLFSIQLMKSDNLDLAIGKESKRPESACCAILGKTFDKEIIVTASVP